ncbi:MAG: hypothetical protein A3B74_02190 [Candidatus Kerfeldbacteria bacterium RIFCSPHIGHO2_02_FULL_42_14]|uniref:Uncharacterized protein n=1 Tax=Candidatus Kerfeldbacteria bacterium RIFCSPHIGHO2_02_FULL_42_14 TaxID=1798540 RepID=A0A1G2ASB7_9BACT|nr:MAG: hypothetical protein A3B74_02190 [Candidatus Kerfeldbacteria bacterium RIFCSPHIGHO2_02_FULL_42_14]OGY80359.1 MAG: hypothetical protein A3E60_04810 [Candidatus Kerfeldbacteria bacterium RIFCSPHIGHO2_12_FULL_42_13]OGY83788.1 MAG: hypothetical protein A3I91_04335 [Candidatus Kerfeldbacteria bacterium RIFCSPLOWO2_02_FULL_42_19]OGY87145.1 MAG: hypothetical protein A3G01_04675 [Candidatus Kerfeldbacteria bacterium RIFCSPLOWO2_12_FULL_43_9]
MLLTLIIVLLVVVILGGGYYLYSQKGDTDTKTTTNASKVSDEADESEDADIEDEDAEEEDGEETVTNLESVSLSNVKDGKGIGTAERKKVDGKYTLTMNTKELPDAPENFEYQAWIEKKVPFSRVNVGKLTKEKDGVFNLEFSSGTDYSAHPFVYVTLEPVNDTNDDPNDQVLSGRFAL